MKLIVMLRGPAASPLIAQAEAAFRERGYDVCVAPSGEFGGLRESVLRSLLLVADVLVAFWRAEDLAEPWFSEIVTDAKRSRKLVGGEIGGTSALRGFKSIEPEIDALVAAVTARLGKAQAARGAKISVEYSDFRRAAAAGDERAWRAFLLAHPNGAFRPLAEAECEIASTPDYRSPQSGDSEAQSAPWRLGLARGSWAAPAGGLTLLGVVAIIALLASQPMLVAPPRTPLLEPSPAQAAAVAPLETGPTVTEVDLAAFDLSAQPTAHARDDLSVSRLPERTISEEEAVLTDELRPRQPISTPAPVETPRSPRLERVAQPVMARNAFDHLQVEPALRSVIEQARRRERYAQDRARRFATARELSRSGARYQGEWDDDGANGLGVASYANGDRYAGSWRQSEPSGMGVLRMRNGARYEGEFVNGAPTGRGVFWRQDGTRLTGAQLFRELVAATQSPEDDSRQ